MKTMAASPVSGSISLLVSASSRSKTLKPNGWKPDQTLNASSAAMPSDQVASAATKAEATRDSGVRSSRNSVTGSSSEIAEVSAATVSSAKKIVPNASPQGMSMKASGSVTNSSPGPALGSRPLANTTGKIAMPAPSAITVSRITTVRAVLIRLTSCPR